jgi:hypothetical protein
MPADRPAAIGQRSHATCWRHYGHACRPVALGHLGHLGHGFKLQAGATGRHALGHLGHCFLGDPNDPKSADLAPSALWVFGSFGSFCHRIKIGAGSGVRDTCMIY